MRTASLLVVASVLLALMAACGQDSPAAPATGSGPGDSPHVTTLLSLVGAGPAGARQVSSTVPEVPAAKSRIPWDPSFGSASLHGIVKFEGTPKKGRTINMDSDLVCKGMHKTRLRIERVALNPDGSLRNVFVYIRKGLEDFKFDPPKEAVVLDQKGCQYAPHIMGLVVGQTLIIRNSDPTSHNIHVIPRRNEEFNFQQSKQGSEKKVILKRAEVMVKLKCDIHTWMGGYVGVLKHPFFAVTGKDGSFEIKNLPPGDYTLGAWQEAYGLRKVKLTVKDGESREVNFTFTPKKKKKKRKRG